MPETAVKSLDAAVAVRSFAELVAALAMTPGLNLYTDELTDTVVRDALRYALVTTAPDVLWERSRQVERVLSSGHPSERDYLVLVGSAVTRVFGVTA
ncbi:hypothetical protein POF50_009140 [Streptomyces sp. SL13]|uniref:Uncharacterized protein n=1 Tax=Streptantibioticus silvisoli TaxID=2705255 RepID=A0AA90GX53_9ACTN|nr:hypothetical protein [Streptantibioticus silvisoli]MDI5969504.1 hypothetical protein [Streptantibioticus silvisoli]